MSLAKRYNPRTSEPILQADWQATAVYHFDPDSDKPIYSIDTPPPTVSGNLHLGHVYSYSHTDFFARFWRMNGRNVFYPMGYDDNGLPTERLVEKTEGVNATDIGRQAFIEKCLAASEVAEVDYKTLWQRLGLSIDWRYSYRTIDDQSRQIAQLSFLQLYEQDLAYRKKAPTIWCPECQTAIAQADLDDLDRQSTFHTLSFQLDNGTTLAIATTRPELLPACVALFVHPSDGRYTQYIGQQAIVPLFGQSIPILADPDADPQKGTGVVMCCTFGDQTDVAWWRTHKLPLIEAINKDGTLSQAAGPFAGQELSLARQQIITALQSKGLLLDQQPIAQAVRIHERCDTPVEYIVTKQWFIRVLEHKQMLLDAGKQINWHPAHMQNRYTQWVENLNWDWCISRQRTFGVPFPIWYCADCGQVQTADPAQLPLDPSDQNPPHPCSGCGSDNFIPETDVLDTWATSSMSPQIVGQWLSDDDLYKKVYPFSIRPQAHEIIRTWAFYTIVKGQHHFKTVPWQDVVISGWGLAPEGTVKLSKSRGSKLSKSRGGGPTTPLAMIEQYSADAVRYWAASTSLGKDATINEDRIQAGAKLVTKLWNVARFSQRFLDGYQPSRKAPALMPADRWILARTQQLISRVTSLMQAYDYATAKSEIELFFWRDLADNYLELVKKRLYENNDVSGQFALYQALLTSIKLLAPLLPHVTERIYQGLFATADGAESVHCAQWPLVDGQLGDETAVAFGTYLLEIATAVRRYKSEHNLSLGSEIACLSLTTEDVQLAKQLATSAIDLTSITRAQEVVVNGAMQSNEVQLVSNGRLHIAVTV